MRASLGASAVRYSFTVTDFHRLPFAGLPAHPSIHGPESPFRMGIQRLLGTGPAQRTNIETGHDLKIAGRLASKPPHPRHARQVDLNLGHPKSR
jgi:hypothetical protein